MNSMRAACGPWRTPLGAIVYCLFIASQKLAAEDIIVDIFKKYRQRGAK